MTRTRTCRTQTSPFPRSCHLALVFLLALGPIAAAAADGARMVPAKGLKLYLEYDGLDAHADAWQATSAYAMFHRSPAGAMTADVVRQVLDRLLLSSPEPRPSGADLLAIQEEIVRHGFCLALLERKDGAAVGVLVLNGLGRKDARAPQRRFARVLMGQETWGNGKIVQKSRLRGRVLYGYTRPAASKPGTKAADSSDRLAWWYEGDDLIVVAEASPAEGGASTGLTDDVASVLDTVEGKASSAATHPGRTAAQAEGRDIKGFDSNGLFFVEPCRATGLIAGFLKSSVGGNRPYEGLTLPAVPYIQDDVQYFAPGPDFPTAISQAARPGGRAQDPGARILPPKTAGTTTVVPRPAPATALSPPVPPAPPARPSLPEETPRLNESRRDPAVVEATLKPGQSPGKKKKSTAEMLGFDGVTRIVGRWGFQGKALLTDVRIEAPAPRRGLLKFFDQPGFRKDRLPPIPRGAGPLLVGSFDPGTTYDALVPVVIESLALEAPAGLPGFDGLLVKEIERVVHYATGERLREDLLAHIGPTWCLYAATDPLDEEAGAATPALLVEVDDAREFGKVLDSLAKHANAYFHDLAKEAQARCKEPDDDPPALVVERLPAPERGYRLMSPSRLVHWLSDDWQPTVLVGKSYVALAWNRAGARAALAAASGSAARWTPPDEIVKAFDCLPGILTSLSVGDARDSTWPETMAHLPQLVQFLGNSLGAAGPESTSSKLLAVLGVPRPGAFRLRLDPPNVPRARALRDLMLPSVLATSADDRGLRFIRREAIPLAGVGPGFGYKTSSEDGATLTISLRPFLFSCIPLELKYRFKDASLKSAIVLRGALERNRAKDD